MKSLPLQSTFLRLMAVVLLGFAYSVTNCLIADDAATKNLSIPIFKVDAAKPSSEIKHALHLKSLIDDDRSVSRLEGPKYFTDAVGLGAEPQTAETHAYFNWYGIAYPRGAKQREIAVVDASGAEWQLTIRDAVFMLSPSQMIGNGKPEEIPAKLNHYKAYEITVASQTKTSEAEKPKATLGTPKLLCVPTAEFHHEEVFEINDAETYLIVFESDDKAVMPPVNRKSVTTLDQFGLNKLGLSGTAWSVAPAKASK